MKHFRIIRPDDWHCHVRDGDALSITVPSSARQFGRVMVMPNLKPPITNIEQALAYRERIQQHISNHHCQPLMSLYLTDNTDEHTLQQAANNAHVVGFKLYPAGATTNSAAGVTDLKKIYPLLDAMQHTDLVLQIHGEVTTNNVDIFDREQQFIDTYLQEIATQFPTLKFVLEHITTKYAVDWINQSRDGIAATITAHHLLANRNHMLVGGIKPHYYCLPVLKRLSDQHALIKAAISGNPKFFLGTDSAPHAQSQKESACGCAGIYTAHAAIELYASCFDAADALDRLEGFASLFGAAFYGLAPNQEHITLVNKPWQVPTQIAFGADHLIPFYAGQTLQWQLT